MLNLTTDLSRKKLQEFSFKKATVKNQNVSQYVYITNAFQETVISLFPLFVKTVHYFLK